MSFNQPPPNPYGQQPPPPGPPPGYGYPQGAVPPQQNPYAQPPGPQGPNPYAQQAGPQGPYGQPGPYGQQPGWGGQVPPPPPGKSNTGKIIGIVAAIVVVAAVGIGVALTAGGGSGGSSAKGGSGGSGGGASDGVKYKLTAPQTVAGTYTLTESKDDAEIGADRKASAAPIFGSVSGGKAMTATYQSSDKLSSLTLTGEYGDVSDPSSAVDTAFAAITANAANSTNGATLTAVGSPQSESPAGFDGVMKCQNFTVAGGAAAGGGGTLPICIWGDSSTVAEVFVFKVSMTGQSMSLGDAADTTAKVRQAARVRIP